jgi:glutaredoxin
MNKIAMFLIAGLTFLISCSPESEEPTTTIKPQETKPLEQGIEKDCQLRSGQDANTLNSPGSGACGAPPSLSPNNPAPPRTPGPITRPVKPPVNPQLNPPVNPPENPPSTPPVATSPTIKNVVLYGNPGCGFCVASEKLLNEKGIPYEFKNVFADTSLLVDLHSRIGAKTFPYVFIDGQYIGGYMELQGLLNKPAAP